MHIVYLLPQHVKSFLENSEGFLILKNDPNKESVDENGRVLVHFGVVDELSKIPFQALYESLRGLKA